MQPTYILWILSAICIIATITALAYGLSPMRKTAGIQSSDGPHRSEGKKLTVVSYFFTSRHTLGEYLEELMNQDYENYDVVLVCDATPQATSAIADEYAALYPNLYVTYIPPGSHNLSRRKLAYTVGIKAAAGEYVLTTITNIRIPSRSWLSEMMTETAGGNNSIVLGYSRQDYDEIRGAGRWYKEFDHLMASAFWIGGAVAGRTYRGDGNNLLFRKELFFREKGYSATIDLVNGDDDIFVCHIAKDNHTAVELSHNTILTTQWQSSANMMWSDMKERYRFTSRFLPRNQFFRAGVLSACQWICLLSAATCVTLTLQPPVLPGPESWQTIRIIPEILPAAAAIASILALWGTETAIYRRVATRLKAVRLWWSVPVFMLWRPIGNLLFSIRHRHRVSHNYNYKQI